MGVQLEIMEFNILQKDFNALSKFEVPQNKIGDLFLAKHSSLYGEGLSHGFQYIRGNQGFGFEHYFDKSIFNKLKFK